MNNPLNNLSIRARLLVVLAIFLLPIGMLAYELNTRLQDSIDFSVQEAKGAKFVSPLLQLLNKISDYQIADEEKSLGVAGMDAVLASAAAKVDGLIGDLERLNASIGSDLDFTSEGLKKHGQPDVTVANLKSKWEAIKASHTYKRASYTTITADILAMIKHTGDASNLILDGDLDSYYIVDAVFNALPVLLRELTDVKVKGFSSLTANAGLLDAAAITEVRSSAFTITESKVPHVHDSITTALKEDANFHGLLPSFQEAVGKGLAEFDAKVAGFESLMVKVLGGQSLDAPGFLTGVNELHDAASAIVQPLTEALEKMIDVRIADLEKSRLEVMAVSGAVVLAAFLMFFVVSGSISGPLKRMTDRMKILADGDTAVEIPSKEDRSEIGLIARAVLVFKENMIQTEKLRADQEQQKQRTEAEKRDSMNKMANNFEASVKTVVTEVSASAEQMRGNAERLNVLAGETKSNSGIVASSATEAAQTATQVAAAAEELTAAIGEISSQIQKSSTVANQASTQAENINQSMHMLVEKSNRVGEVIQFITNIASQINLLALNATIESARAGEAGRGFAVVASEVKNLANQTAKATEEIVQQVQSMQEATHEAVESVGQIIGIISEISSNTASVAAAVEEQSAATNEISRNIAHTAAGTDEISRSIVAVEKGADETGGSSRQVLGSAQALSGHASVLSQKVDEFLATVRSS